MDGTASMDRRTGEIEDALTTNQAVTGDLEMRVKTLADRLEPILRPPEPLKADGDDAPERSYSSPLAQVIASRTRDLRDMVENLASTIDRIEL